MTAGSEDDGERLIAYGKRIELAIGRHGYTQKQVAEAIGVSENSMSAWVGGSHEPTRKRRSLLAAHLQDPTLLEIAYVESTVSDLQSFIQEAASQGFRITVERESDLRTTLLTLRSTIGNSMFFDMVEPFATDAWVLESKANYLEEDFAIVTLDMIKHFVEDFERGDSRN